MPMRCKSLAMTVDPTVNFPTQIEPTVFQQTSTSQLFLKSQYGDKLKEILVSNNVSSRFIHLFLLSTYLLHAPYVCRDLDIQR